MVSKPVIITENIIDCTVQSLLIILQNRTGKIGIISISVEIILTDKVIVKVQPVFQSFDKRNFHNPVKRSVKPVFNVFIVDKNGLIIFVAPVG